MVLDSVGGRQRAGRLALTVTAALLASACNAAPAAEPPPDPPSVAQQAAPKPTAAPEDPPTPANPEQERLEQLRASDAFLEFAEHDRAITAPWAKAARHNFAPKKDGEVLFRWTNEQELWNDVALPVRDHCLLAGPEPTRRMWNTDTLVPALLYMVWPNEETEGRGQFVRFHCLVDDEGRPVELVHGVLIAADDKGVGSVVGRMPTLVVREDDAPDFQTARRSVVEQTWQWVWASSAVMQETEQP